MPIPFQIVSKMYSSPRQNGINLNIYFNSTLFKSELRVLIIGYATLVILLVMCLYQPDKNFICQCSDTSIVNYLVKSN